MSNDEDGELNSGSNINLNTTTPSIDGALNNSGAACISPEYLNKSYEDDNDEDDDDDRVEYNFVDDFTDLSKELDDNWIQEDELWFNNLTPAMKQAAANASSGSGLNPFLLVAASSHHNPTSIHPPRILHRIDEESSVSSSSSSSSEAESSQDEESSTEIEEIVEKQE